MKLTGKEKIIKHMKKIKWKALGEICSIFKGEQLNKKDMLKIATYPVINGGTSPSGYIENYNQKENTITISQGGASVGYVNFIETKFWLGAHAFAINPNDKVSKRYIYHFLKKNQYKLENKKVGATIPNISKNDVQNFLIPLLPLKKQTEITAVLDKFTELTEELTVREAQYDYYRDMLLSHEWIEREDGKEVEWKALEEVIEYEQPTKYIVSSKKYNDKFSTPVLTAGQSFILGYTDESEGIYNASTEKPVVIFDDFTTSNHWIDFDFKVKSSALKILKAKDSVISLKYCYYYMQTILFDISEHRRKWISQYSKIKIPFPSLETQQKIVKILDNFETLVNDIKQDLPKEIELRQKQYEYYREKLLTFEEK